MITRLRPSDYTEMPWKNGGGITREVALRTNDAGFLWRLSIADVAIDGPFSPFPDRHRILTVIEGQGITLTDTTTGDVLTAVPLQPVRFRGDQQIDATLIDGAIRDFNVMYDPDRVVADVRVIRTNGPVSATAFYCVSGTIMADSELLQQGDTALMGDVEGDVAITVTGGGCLLAISLRNLA